MEYCVGEKCGHDPGEFLSKVYARFDRFSRLMLVPLNLARPRGRRPDHREQRFDRFAAMTLHMTHDIKMAFRQIDWDLMQQSRFEAGRGH
jgi:hypothetical protein